MQEVPPSDDPEYCQSALEAAQRSCPCEYHSAEAESFAHERGGYACTATATPPLNVDRLGLTITVRSWTRGAKMGSAKEYWMDTRPNYAVGIHCPACKRFIESNIRTPEVDDNAADDTVEEVSEFIECPYCDQTWAVDVSATKSNLTGLVLKWPQTEVEFREIDWSGDSDWDDGPDPEPDPHAIFTDALREWRADVRAIADDKDGESSRNRMLFTQLYSIIEAFLSDAIIGLTLRDRRVQAKLVTVLPSLKDKSVSLITLAEDPEILIKMIKTALQATSFHSLGTVNALSLKALSKPILPADNYDRTLLIDSVELRHDCVHRNGRRKDGTKRTEITRGYLETIGRHFKILARDLNSRISEMDGDRWALEPFDK